jgi:hypothetical protein
MKKLLVALLVATAGVTPLCEAGVVTYTLNGQVFRIQTRAGAAPLNITKQLNQIAPRHGDDSNLNISPNGQWLVMRAQRFDAECTDWPCLVVMSAAVGDAQVVRAAGQLIHAEGFSAIASTGDTIVYPAAGGTHALDLWKVTRDTAGNWGAPTVLTGKSPYAWNSQPALSSDASRVLFDCGNEPYGGAGTAICEVETTGKGFRVVITPQQTPAGYPAGTALHHADYADGNIVFEADWGGERLWRLPAGSTLPRPLAPRQGNDNSPCVLASGEIVSLWLNQPANPAGLHELKLLGPNGYRMLVTGKDISDIGIGCGGF